jgi:beta-lactamase superfamily II metal-dependent hydrolase
VFKLHVVQARYGDCLILEYGTAGKRGHVLVDGGPPRTYEEALEAALKDIVGAGGALDLVVLSHIDNDHIVGLLDLFAAIESETVSGEVPPITVDNLWHNSFERSIDPTGEILQGMQSLMMMAGITRIAMPLSADAFYGMKEGHRLRVMAHKLGIPPNKEFKDDRILAGAGEVRKLGPLELAIAGPTLANLDALRADWLKWLEDTTDKMRADPKSAAMADNKVPNLSSIVLLAKCDGKSVLLTGDARGDHIIEGLTSAQLAQNGKLHVDVLKVQHHGSDRNATRAFFDAITADTYVVSADGRYGNPDYATLSWIVESARDQQRPITLVTTNETEATKKLQKQRKPKAYGYRLVTLERGKHSVEVALAD